MFPRIVKSKKKSGTYEYLVISELIRKNGKVTTKNVAVLGNLKRFDKEVVENLIDGLIKLFKVDQFALSQDVEILESLEHGNIIFWQHLWRKLQLSELINQELKCKESRIKLQVARYVELMVVNRCTDPLSKLGTSRWVSRTCYKMMKGYHQLDLNVEYFYRSMDYLLKIKDQLELRLFEKLQTLFSVNVRVTFYDITSSYFHTDSCPLSANGLSRDGLPQKKQIVIGVVTTYEGYPIKHYVFEGNKKDEKTVVEVINDLKRSFHIEETIFVGDRGMITKLNQEHIRDNGFDYIMGVKCRQNEIVETFLSEEALAHEDYQDYHGLKIQEKMIVIGDFLLTKIRKLYRENKLEFSNSTRDAYRDFITQFGRLPIDEIPYKDFKKLFTELGSHGKNQLGRRVFSLLKKYHGKYEDRIRLVICLNEERKKVSRNKRTTQLERVTQSLNALFLSYKEKNFEFEKALNAHFEGYKRSYRKFYTFQRSEETKEALGFKTNQKILEYEKKLDGLFILTTTRKDLPIQKVIDSYKNLQEVELLFDDLKNFVDIRPVRHWLEPRVRAHVFLCILALLLKRMVEIQFLGNKALMEPLEEIRTSKLVKYKVKFSKREERYEVIPKVTQTTTLQKKLFKAVGIHNPMSIEKFVW